MSRWASPADSAWRDHPADDVAAEDVEDDVEVEVGPLHRAQQFRDVPRPDLVRGGRQQFRLLVDRVAELVAALLDLCLLIEDAVHGADGAVVAPSSSRVA